MLATQFGSFPWWFNFFTVNINNVNNIMFTVAINLQPGLQLPCRNISHLGLLFGTIPGSKNFYSHPDLAWWLAEGTIHLLHFIESSSFSSFDILQDRTGVNNTFLYIFPITPCSQTSNWPSSINPWLPRLWSSSSTYQGKLRWVQHSVITPAG